MSISGDEDGTASQLGKDDEDDDEGADGEQDMSKEEGQWSREDMPPTLNRRCCLLP